MHCFTPQRRVLSVIRGKIDTLNYSYSGSWDIPIDWLELSGLFPYQKIGLINPSPQNKGFEPTVYTYVLPTPRGSACMNANGGIAHYFEKNGEVIIQGYGTYLSEEHALKQSPIFLDTRTLAKAFLHSIPALHPSLPDWMDFVSGKLHFASVDAIIEAEEVIEGDKTKAQPVLEYLRSFPGIQLLGQPTCILSEDLAHYGGFQSFEAISLYPANGYPRFNRSVMCCIIPNIKNTFVLIGEGLKNKIKPKDRMIACRYTSLNPRQIHSHTANVHILNSNNQSERVIKYCMTDYLKADLTWKK